ncbi:MAG TPA: chorismate mutase [Solirubrobacteraceae bacterium]|jgi:chorismate mutase
MSERLHALRGAITVEHNDAKEILEATGELLKALVERNSLSAEDIVSCIFTVTDDLDAQFPAVAARQLGFQHVPLLCAREIPVPGSLPMVIRVLIHYYPADGQTPTHLYMRGASVLRSDLQSAQ